MSTAPSRRDTAISLVSLMLGSQGKELPRQELEAVLSTYASEHPEDPTLSGLLIQTANFGAFMVALYADAEKTPRDEALKDIATGLAQLP